MLEWATLCLSLWLFLDQAAYYWVKSAVCLCTSEKAQGKLEQLSPPLPPFLPSSLATLPTTLPSLGSLFRLWAPFVKSRDFFFELKKKIVMAKSGRKLNFLLSL